MRSFAVAAIIGAASAAAVYPIESSSAPAVYETSSAAPVYETSSAAPVYETSSAAPVYETSSKHEASTAYNAYPIVSSSAKYDAYPVPSSSVKYEEYTSTKVVKETTFVCPTPTVVTYEEKTYTVTQSTVLSIPAYSTVVTVSHKPSAPGAYSTGPAHSTKTPEAETSSKPVVPASTYAPYPSKNVTAPHSAPQGTATGHPTSTKPSTPEFTGAAAQAGVGLLAVFGALAAFL